MYMYIQRVSKTYHVMLLAKTTVRKHSQAFRAKTLHFSVIPENTIAESAKLSYDIRILLAISISSSKLTT